MNVIVTIKHYNAYGYTTIGIYRFIRHSRLHGNGAICV